MPSVIQEKFQIDLPEAPEADHQWKSQKSVEAKKGTPYGENVFFNTLPPGMDIEDAEIADIREQRTILSGKSDVSMDTTSEGLKNGFTKRPMRPTDDMYTREHNDAFYDDVGGFVERNNVLDRL